MRNFLNNMRGKAASAMARGGSVVSLVLAVALVWAFVPPPRPASAVFAEQATWAGSAGGTVNALVLTVNNMQSPYPGGVIVRFNPSGSNTGPVTISINGASATALFRPSSIGATSLSGSELRAGIVTTIINDGSNWVLQSPLDTRPIGDTIQFRGSTSPPGYLIEDGSCVSRTTYAPLFSVIGAIYSACDGSTTFGVPNSKGTVFVAADGQGSGGLQGRITTATCATPNTLGATCGLEKNTISQTFLPNISLPTSVVLSDTRTWGVTSANGAGLGVQSASNTTGNFQALAVSAGAAVTPLVTVLSGNLSVTSASTSLGGSNTPLPGLPPSSIGIRAIKY
jgi:microcystin-dependent protein